MILKEIPIQLVYNDWATKSPNIWYYIIKFCLNYSNCYYIIPIIIHSSYI